MKGAAFIVLALFIDGLQAGITAALSIIAAFPGTIAGGAVGCYVGSNILGSWGCAIGGFVLGFLGTFLDGFGVLTEPIGLMIGFAVSICFTCTFGVLLVGLLIFNKMYYPRFIFGGSIIELLPGFSVLPSWTAMTVGCVWRKNKADKEAMMKNAQTTIVEENPPIEAESRVAQVDGIRAPEMQTNAA